jgi:hypothetical protein
MIRTALDSDMPGDMTGNVDFLLTYSDLVTDPAGYERQRPAQQVVYIDRGLGDPDNKATIIDIERGALTVEHLPDWYDAKVRARLPFLTYYCNRSTIASVMAVMGGRHMYRWIATLDGTVAVAGFTPMQSPDLVQILPASSIGIHADLSLILCETWRPTMPASRVTHALLQLQDAARAIAPVAAQIVAAENVIRGAL